MSFKKSSEACQAARSREYLMGRDQVSERRAVRAARFCLSSIRYQSYRDPLTALRQRMRELAQTRVRFGYRLLLVLLRREGWELGKKRCYRLYTEEGLALRRKHPWRMRPPCIVSSVGRRPHAMTSGAWTSSPTSSPTVDGSER